MRLALGVSSWAILIVRKLSGANITVSGEKLPDSPIVFVANHFTRFETFVVPHILYHKHGRSSRSLADDGVFVGFLGKFMHWVGTISNKNKDRDCIIVEDLLSGNDDWVIYPEGYMVKDKKISFRDGEFCTHSPEHGGPIHTGAAVMALKAKILQLRAQTNETELKHFCDNTAIVENIDSSLIDPLLHIKMIPVSITYYPVRPGKNYVLEWIDSKFHQRNKRLFEELEIEVNLLMDAHMNIRFGKPISLDAYMEPLLEDKKNLYNDAYVNSFIDKQRKVLTTDVMKRVYSQMQIHFDHIFILSLVTMPTVKVCPSYLKTLIYKNARSLRKLQDYNVHHGLTKALYKLILDDNYAPFVSAIELAISHKILYADSEGEYLFDRSLLEKEYPFHKVRVKNTLQVILNEIKWQDEIVKVAEENSKFTEVALKNDNYKHLLQREMMFFKKEYKKYTGKTATKRNKGAPITFFDTKNDVGVILSHGYMAAPKELRSLGEYLFSKGINVHVIRLRGHATDPEALKNVDMEDWVVDFERAFIALKQVCSKVYIGGFSMGGLLALEHASRHKVDGVIAINTALKLHDLRVSYVVPTLQLFNEMIAYFNAQGIMEWIDNSKTEQPTVNYHKHPLASIAQMERLMSKVEHSLKNITSSILIIQGDNDPVVKRESGKHIYDKVMSKDKKLLILPRERHSILADDKSDEVFEAVYGFIHNTSK